MRIITRRRRGNIQPPQAQASYFSFSSIDRTIMTAAITRGNGSGVIIVMKQDSAVDFVPINNTTYTQGQVVSGNTVVYVGTGNSVNLTSLTPGKLYFFRAFEFNGVSGVEKYATTENILNPFYQYTYAVPNDISGLKVIYDTDTMAFTNLQNIDSITDDENGYVLTPSASDKRPSFRTNYAPINNKNYVRVADGANLIGVKSDWDWMHKGDSTFITVQSPRGTITGYIFDTANGSSANIGRSIIRDDRNVVDVCSVGSGGNYVWNDSSRVESFVLDTWYSLVSRYKQGQAGNDHTLEINNVEVGSNQGTQTPSASTSFGNPTFFNRQDLTLPSATFWTMIFGYDRALEGYEIAALQGGSDYV